MYSIPQQASIERLDETTTQKLSLGNVSAPLCISCNRSNPWSAIGPLITSSGTRRINCYHIGGTFMLCRQVISSLTNAIHCCSYSFESSTPSGRTGKLLGMGFILPRGLRTFENMSNSELHPSPYAGPHCQNFRQMHIGKVRNSSNIQPQVGIGNSVAISGDIPPVYRAERYLGLAGGHCQRR